MFAVPPLVPPRYRLGTATVLTGVCGTASVPPRYRLGTATVLMGVCGTASVRLSGDVSAAPASLCWSNLSEAKGVGLIGCHVSGCAIAVCAQAFPRKASTAFLVLLAERFLPVA